MYNEPSVFLTQQRRDWMNVPSPVDVTELLMDWGNGNRAALDSLMPLVYDELHRLAARQIRKESPGHRCKPRCWSTKPISASSIKLGCAGRTARSSLALPPN